jgi:phosphatidylglycerol---prolipoprotein diacylglyceryl transferase
MPFTPALAALVPVLALIALTPDPIAFQLGPVPVYWYGVCYAVGLTVAYIVITREARRRGLDAHLVDNGIIIVAVAALIGGRLYHVIDQWVLYKDDPIKIFLPPYTGLGVYGGIITGTIAAWYITRRWHQSFAKWADVIAPGLFVMQAIGRLGNFFNQELYGPPTNLPWGIAIDCAHRVVEYPCTLYPEATTGFQPLFLYESLSGAIGAITLLWIARRFGSRMRPGDLILIFFIWYAAVRFALESLRVNNWTFFGLPTAMLVSVIVIVLSLIVLAWRHRPGSTVERWGDPPPPEDELLDDEEWIEDDEAEDEDAAEDDDEPGDDDGAEADDGADEADHDGAAATDDADDIDGGPGTDKGDGEPAAEDPGRGEGHDEPGDAAGTGEQPGDRPA